MEIKAKSFLYKLTVVQLCSHTTAKSGPEQYAKGLRFKLSPQRTTASSFKFAEIEMVPYVGYRRGGSPKPKHTINPEQTMINSNDEEIVSMVWPRATRLQHGSPKEFIIKRNKNSKTNPSF